MKRFYISDLHIGHDNILKYDNRPFKNTDEMEDEIVRRWNNVVSAGDIVYVLGDMCWKVERKWIDFVGRLNGNIVLIKGNHDPTNMPGRIRKLFQDIKDIKTIRDGDYEVIMCHYPLLFYPHSNKENTIMLCGHVHTTKENDFLEKFRTEMSSGNSGSAPHNGHGRIINVGCMMPWMDYTPRTLDEILERTGM